MSLNAKHMYPLQAIKYLSSLAPIQNSTMGLLYSTCQHVLTVFALDIVLV